MIWQQANAMCTSEDDMNLTPTDLGTIKVQTHIIQGDRDPNSSKYPWFILVDHT